MHVVAGKRYTVGVGDHHRAAELFELRKNMGMLFQSSALFTDLSVFENVAFPLRVHTNLPDEMRVTVTLKKVICGTELNIEQAGVPDVIPAEMCYLGWQESLLQLSRLVDPEIRDE